MIGLRRSFVSALLLSCIALGSAPCAADEAPTYRIGPGDILQIAVYAGGEVQENFTVQVSPSGTISTPLLGEVSIAGMLPQEAAKQLGTLLAERFYVNPQVLLTVKEIAGKVNVLGEVRRTGAYSIRDAPTLLSAIIYAGGFTDFAAQSRVKVMRTVNGHPLTLQIDLRKVQKGKQPDLPLLPGDRIEVPHRRF